MSILGRKKHEFTLFSNIKLRKMSTVWENEYRSTYLKTLRLLRHLRISKIYKTRDSALLMPITIVFKLLKMFILVLNTLQRSYHEFVIQNWTVMVEAFRVVRILFILTKLKQGMHIYYQTVVYYWVVVDKTPGQFIGRSCTCI